MTTERITAPLAKLSVAPENARAGAPVANVDALAANIAAFGVLQPLLAYRTKTGFAIVAGARRLAALQKIGAADAPIELHPKERALELSLAENEQRVAMSPVEQALAWAKMVKGEADLVAVANAFGVSERFVQQRIKLAGLHKPILEALRKNEISLAVAEAYASAPAERQAALFKRHGKDARRYEIREDLEDGKLASDDRLALFVGEAAYLAAGGRIESDLFANSGTPDPDAETWRDDREPEGFWLDRELADRLAAEKIEAECEKLRAQGWGFVETGEHFPWGRFDEVKAAKTKEERAKLGAFVALDRKGKLEITRNLRLSGSARAPARGIGGAKGSDAPKAKAPPMTNAAHEDATRIASTIVGRELARHPGIALVALTAQLARKHFDFGKAGDGYAGQDVLSIGVDRDWSPRRHKPIALLSDPEAEALEAKLEKELAPHAAPGALEAFLAGLPTERVLEMLAVFVGASVSCGESSPGQKHKARRAKLAKLGELCFFAPATHWTPSVEWLKGLSRAELEKLARGFSIPVGKTKAATAAAVAAAAEARQWTPKLVAELVGAAYVEPKALPPTGEASPAPVKKGARSRKVSK